MMQRRFAGRDCRGRAAGARAGAILLAMLLAAGAADPARAAGPAVAAPTLKPDDRIALVLDRLAFGPSAATLAEIRALGVDRWIDQQLTPERVPENPALLARLQGLSTQSLSPVDLFLTYGPQPAPPGQKRDPEEVKARRQAARIIVNEAQTARLARATESNRQLQEVMVAFWADHFNIFTGKGLDHLWIGDFENRAIRPHALGRFRDLLEATAHHPAMLFYLDNWQNTAPGSPGARGREAGLNENYAREVMELHTLGVGGGYSQDDVIQLARILTGWGISRPRAERLERQREMRLGFAMPPAPVSTGFTFDASRHDTADKQFLGRTIRGRSGPEGEMEGEEALDLLARSPTTARHLAFQLAQYFVADTPDPALVEALAQRYLATDGDIAQVLRTLFASRAFWASTGAKYKTPYEFTVSAVRATGLPLDNVRPLLGAMSSLGQPLFGCQTPDGWKNTQEAWLNPDATVKRAGIATEIGRHRLPFDRPSPNAEMTATPVALPMPGGGPGSVPPAGERGLPLDPTPIAQLMGPDLSARTRGLVAASPPDLQAALLLGSPDFMRR